MKIRGLQWKFGVSSENMGSKGRNRTPWVIVGFNKAETAHYLVMVGFYKAETDFYPIMIGFYNAETTHYPLMVGFYVRQKPTITP